MSISKKKLKKIEAISLMQKVIDTCNVEYLDTSFTDNPPDMWSKYEKAVFDMLNEMEMRIKKEIIKILEE